MTRALVLGGGGVTGLAWETGLAAGLVERGVDLAGATDVIGTSAGSVLGSWITSGRTLAEAADAQAHAPTVESGAGESPDPERLTRMFVRWSSIGTYSPEDGREVGAIAREVSEAHEQLWVDAMAQQIGTEVWPSTLRISAIDTNSGEILIFGSRSGVPLARAVAASCAVPAIFPTVGIDGRRFMDGAIPTGTHAHRALERGATRVLIVAAFDERTPGIGPLMARERETEVARLRDAGVRVMVIRPSEKAAGFLTNSMDVSKRSSAVETGFEQGRSEADALADWL